MTRNLAASLPLFMSVGNETFAGKLVHKAVGSARFVPVSVSSRVLPRSTPSGKGTLIVGDCGATTIGAAFG